MPKNIIEEDDNDITLMLVAFFVHKHAHCAPVIQLISDARNCCLQDTVSSRAHLAWRLRSAFRPSARASKSILYTNVTNA